MLKRAKERAVIKDPKERGERLEPALFELVAAVVVAAGVDDVEVVEVVVMSEYWNN